MCLSKANIWPVNTRESDNVILSLKLIRFIIFEFFEIAYILRVCALRKERSEGVVRHFELAFLASYHRIDQPMLQNAEYQYVLNIDQVSVSF